jgi:hypothetical protein
MINGVVYSGGISNYYFTTVTDVAPLAGTTIVHLGSSDKVTLGVRNNTSNLATYTQNVGNITVLQIGG